MAGPKRAIVVGCGGMGRAWIKNLLNNSRAVIAALVDIRPEAAQKAAAELKLDPGVCFDSLGAALARVQADFVVDVTIPEAHCPTTIAALTAGLPVIGEKPMAESLDAARRMVAAAEKTGRLYMVSQSRRYDVNHVATRRLIESGAIGDLTTVNCDFYIGAHFGGFRDQMPSPLILDMAIHHFDLCRFLTAADPVAVYALEFNPKGSWYAGDVNASAVFEMSNGVVFTYRGSWCGEGCHTSWNGDWRLIGSHGTILMEKDQLPKGSRPKPNAPKAFHLEQEPVAAAAPALNGTGIAGSLNEFLDYLETGRKPQGECHDNIKSLAMVFAVIEASRRKARVPVTV